MQRRLIIILLFASLSLAALFVVPQRAEQNHNAGSRRYEISEYDDLMRAVEAVSGIDWRLLSAIANVESEFLPDAVSKRGAVGLMQVMPAIGRHFGFSDETLADPHTNIWTAAMLLCEIESAVGLPHNLDPRDRWGIILACYNGGLGHVIDARRLARLFGEDDNSWATVSRYLRLENEPEYYENEVVTSGKFIGGRRTTAYVRDVLDCYEDYCRRIIKKRHSGKQ